MTNWFNLDDDGKPDQDKVWTLADIYADLGSINDVARALNVTKGRVGSWVARRERIRFPEPVTRAGKFAIYSIEECRYWFHCWKEGKKHYPRRYDQVTVNTKPFGAGENFFAHDLQDDT